MKASELKISEAKFQQQIIDLCRLLGYKVAHFRPALNRRGQWTTAVQGDGAGYPDLTIVGRGRVIFAELKAEGKYPQPAQKAWLADLKAAGAEVHVWRPADIDEIARILQGTN